MTISRFMIFFVVMSLFLLGASQYLARRANQAFGLGKKAEKTFLFVMLGVVLALGASRVFQIKILGQVAFAVLLAVLITTGLHLLADLLKFILSLPARLVGRQAPSSNLSAVSVTEPNAKLAGAAESAEKNVVESPVVPSLPAPVVDEKPMEKTPLVANSRRVFLGQAVTGSAMLVGSGSSLYGSVFGRSDFSVEEIAVKIPGLSKRLDSYTLVQISDIHFGLYVGEREIRQAEDLVRSARPDRLVLTGDLIDSQARYAEVLGQFIRRLSPLTRDGVVVIAGNHDWYAGVDEIMDAAQAAGAKVLRNDGFVIGDNKDGLAMLGVDDVWAKRSDPSQGPDLDKAISRVPADLPRVLLCHNPVFFPEAAGKVALQLSGHTHGGQINLGPIRPGDMVLPYGYVQGRYERNGSQLYVNRGFGTAGPPARIGSPPEITRIVLVSG